jgi:zinc transporter, ZIP family
MAEAAFWGFVGGFALVIGAALTLTVAPGSRLVGLIMAFGSGVLVSAVAYELVGEAFASAGGHGAVALGLATGALTFFLGDARLERQAASQSESGSGGRDIVLGAVLDGIPESIVIGTSLLGGGSVSLAMVAAVFISNLPESIAASDGLARSGTPPVRIFGLWLALSVVCAVAAALGYGVVGALPASVGAFVQAFAAGALLTMLGDSMIPEAYARARQWAGLCLVLGFAVSFGLTALEATG